MNTISYALKISRYVLKESGIPLTRALKDLFKAIVLREREGFSGIIRIHSEIRPDKIAVKCNNKSITYRELYSRAENLASFFSSKGFAPGTRIGVMLKNSLEVPEVWIAMGLSKFAGVPISWRLKSEEVRYIIEDSNAEAIIYSEDVRKEVLNCGAKLKYFISVGKTASDNEINYNDIISKKHSGGKVSKKEEPELIIYTSGTTGKPKGAQRKINPSSVLMVNSAIYEFCLKGSDRHLVVCPLYHSAPFFFAQLTLVLGATLVIMPKFNPEGFLQMIEKEKITSTFVVPFMLAELFNLPERVRKKYNTSSLRTFICAAAPLSPYLKRWFVKEFGSVLYEFYGATETGINTVLKPEDIDKKAETVGRVAPFNKIKILDENKKELPPGEPGEIYISNPYLMNGYYRREKDTKEAMAGEFLSVGDVGKLDENGYLYILDRKKDMVISGGVNIYPAEIEHVLSTHPSVKICAVVGVPDKKWGEKLKAFVVLKDNIDINSEELESFLRDRIAGYKIPKEWKFVKELPMTPSGKVLKRELRNSTPKR